MEKQLEEKSIEGRFVIPWHSQEILVELLLYFK